MLHICIKYFDVDVSLLQLVNLDPFSKFLKYFKYFEKRSELTKNSDFFAGGERATLSHHFELS
jgi:hypothetical protein